MSSDALRGVSCIIPAYNEQIRIAPVVQTALAHPLIAEVIVVNDGSTDATGTVLASIEGISVVTHDRNLGKSRALASALEVATHPYVLFLDADLRGLASEHITALITPVLEGNADASISLRGHTLRVWRWLGLDYLSGERSFDRRILAGRLDEIRALPRFGFEVYLNDLWIARRYRVAIVPLEGLESPLKFAKYGFAQGVRSDVLMLRDLLRTRSFIGLARQILALRRLRVRPRPGAPT
ncbi:MAG: glycosyltransferase family 2 protein [Dehalococcoidia bacterium]